MVKARQYMSAGRLWLIGPSAAVKCGGSYFWMFGDAHCNVQVLGLELIEESLHQVPYRLMPLAKS